MIEVETEYTFLECFEVAIDYNLEFDEFISLIMTNCNLSKVNFCDWFVMVIYYKGFGINIKKWLKKRKQT